MDRTPAQGPQVGRKPTGQGLREDAHDTWLIRLSSSNIRQGSRRSAWRSLGDDGRALAGGHSLIPMMKLRLATPGAPHRSRRHRRAQRHPRADGNDIVIGAMTTQHELIASDLARQESPDAARDLVADRRSAGALRRHDRRQCRQWRSRQRHAGGDDVPGRELSRRGQGRRTPHRGARVLPGRLFHCAGARRDRSPPFAFRCRPPATATPTKSSSARSATTPQPPRPSC